MNIRTIEAHRSRFYDRSFRLISTAINEQASEAIELIKVYGSAEAIDKVSEDPIKKAYDLIIPPICMLFSREIFQYAKSQKLLSNPDPYLEEMIRKYLGSEMLRRIKSVSDYTKELLREALIEALERGGSLEDAVKTIRRYVPDMVKWRAERIAATEIVAASNAGSIMGADATGYDYKKVWMAILDSRTRRSHVDAHGQTVGKYEAFKVDVNVLRYPGDPLADASETVNCRCVVGYSFD